MRAGAAFFARAPLASLASFGVLALFGTALGCEPASPATNWTCQWDASESRPLSDEDAALGPDGSLPTLVCEDTCGPPVHACTFTRLDGGVPGAICPVCTF